MKKKYILIAILFLIIISVWNNFNEAFANDIRENSLVITKQPKYIIMDPNEKTPTFVDDQGKTPEISGYWSSKFLNSNKEFDLCLIHKDLSSINFPWNSIWYSNHINEDSLFDNKKLINNFQNISLLPLLNSTSGYSSPLKNIPPQSEYKFAMDIGIGTDDYFPNWKWVYASNTIPFYIKAPKIIINDSVEKMIKNQKIVGKGQVGDTVTIKDGNKTWTGTVNSDGNFTIDTNGGLNVFDNISITQVNGTGDKSISDPVNLEITAPNMGSTPINFKINSMYLPSNLDGNKLGPSETKPHIIQDKTNFGLLFTPEKFDFGGLNDLYQGNTIKNTLNSNKFIGVGDVRKDSPGWQLTAKASVLTNSSDNNTLDGNITMNTVVKHISFDGKSYSIDSSTPEYAKGQTPTTTKTVDLKLGGAATIIMSAEKGKGTGLWATDMNNVTLNSTNTNNVTSGSYEGTITWNLLNTPNL